MSISPVTTRASSFEVTIHPIRKHNFPSPKLLLRLDDLSHPAMVKFLKHFNAATDLEEQVQNVLNLLYNVSSERPGTRSITLVLRAFEGVAYTTGIALDGDHKEIHFSLGYIQQVGGDVRHELLGVVCHELVHAFQWNARGTCNGGLIEGIADYVRLNAGLAAQHWKKEADGAWDAGYQHTGFFLDWLDKKFGAGTIKRLNAALEKQEYDEKRLFTNCCGGFTVQELWRQYGEDVKNEGRSVNPARAAMIPIPTHSPAPCPRYA